MANSWHFYPFHLSFNLNKHKSNIINYIHPLCSSFFFSPFFADRKIRTNTLDCVKLCLEISKRLDKFLNRSAFCAYSYFFRTSSTWSFWTMPNFHVSRKRFPAFTITPNFQLSWNLILAKWPVQVESSCFGYLFCNRQAPLQTDFKRGPNHRSRNSIFPIVIRGMDLYYSCAHRIISLSYAVGLLTWSLTECSLQCMQ